MKLQTASFLLCGLVAAVVGARLPSPGAPVYVNPQAPLEERVNALYSQLTQDEKLSLLSGTGFTTQPIPRLGIPPMGMADAGQGVRGGTGGTQGPATLFPAEVVMASTWDAGLLHSIGRAIGEELQNKGEGAQIILGPDINIHRSPLGGRNGESFTEDPFLNAALATSYIQGVQSTGASACAKHYVCNNEEVDRNTVDVHVGERALREIYLPAFHAAVEDGGVWSVMAAYNKINGPYATANHPLETDIMKDGWGFNGIIMSDWGAVHDTAGAVNGGCDLEMPGGSWMTPDKLRAALESGAISQASVDDSARRIIRTIVRVGLMNGPRHPDHTVVNSPEHQRLAYQTAAEGIILLKNQHDLLPLDASRIRSIAVVGPAADHIQAGAEGSPSVQPFYQIQPLDGIKQRVGPNVAVNYVEGTTLQASNPDVIPTANLSPPDAAAGIHGLQGEYFSSPDLTGQPYETRTDAEVQSFRRGAGRGPAGAGRNGRQESGGAGASAETAPAPGSVRWSGALTAPATGKYTMSLMTDAGARVYIDNKPVIDDATPQGGRFMHSAAVDLTAGQQYPIRVEVLGIQRGLRVRLGWILPSQNNIAAAVNAAAHSDVAVVFVTTHGTDGEGRDRPSMALPGDQDLLIQQVAAANPRTIVVINSGTPVLMTGWLDRVGGVLDAGFPGEEAGHAIASILFGDVNPSGKLTDTIGVRREDYPDYSHFPGTDGVVDYTEGVYVGYRHFDKAGIKPLFPFGYGLSYTRFRYSHLQIPNASLAPGGTLNVRMDVTNTGSRAGAEVVELYLRDLQPQVDRPVRELKGFGKVFLQPGETRTLNFTVAPQDLAYYDAGSKEWKANPGAYEAEIGASSRDIRLSGRFRLTGTYTAPPR